MLIRMIMMIVGKVIYNNAMNTVRNMGTVVFDIDETLTMRREEKSKMAMHCFNAMHHGVEPLLAWAAWNAMLVDDVPNPHMVKLYHVLKAQGYRIVLMSARGECTRATTEVWLHTHGITGYDALILRPYKYEAMGSGEYKATMVDEALGGWAGITLCVDDSTSVLDVFKAHGVRTINPAA